MTFYAGDLAYLLACTYETCYDRFSVKEREQMEQLMERIIKFYKRRFFGGTEIIILRNHLWQFTSALLQTP